MTRRWQQHRKQLWLVLALLCAPKAAQSQNVESMQLAQELGNLIASEKFCNLEYDQDAISAFIKGHVREDDMSFAGTLQLMTAGAEFQLKQMSPSAKTAHCAQTARVARSYKFVK